MAGAGAAAPAAPAAPAADPGLHWLWPTTDTQTHPAVSQGSPAHSVRAQPKGHTGAKQAAREPRRSDPVLNTTLSVNQQHIYIYIPVCVRTLMFKINVLMPSRLRAERQEGNLVNAQNRSRVKRKLSWRDKQCPIIVCDCVCDCVCVHECVCACVCECTLYFILPQSCEPPCRIANVRK